MPIKLDRELPVLDILRKENVFIMDNKRANHQDIRPIRFLIVNLMPTKETTELQLLRLLANTPLQINIDFLYMRSHHSKNTAKSHLETFYKTFEDVKDNYYDGLIVTGAPVETLRYEEVDYWEELCQIFDWAKSHVYSTLHLCWGAQAGLYYKYGIPKAPLPQKLSGIFAQTIEAPSNPLVRGFDDVFMAPHSRHTKVTRAAIEQVEHLEIVASGKEVDVSIVASKDLREVYSFGHLEYDRGTLDWEYQRDVKAGKEPHLPAHYYINDDPSQAIPMQWNLAATTFFSNWINYAVYQETPYLLEQLGESAGI